MKFEKAALRREVLKKRTAYDGAEDSSAIVKAIKSLDVFKKAKSVMIYMPIKGEVDVRGLLSEEKIFLTPVTDGDDMYAALLDGQMIKGNFSVPEPKEKKPFDKDKIDAVIVPGTVFGKDFNRIGFGKGYYDKFLRGMKAVKIGVCYSFQTVESIEAEPHDVKLDYIITEGEVWNRENT